jgi:hypothetical protein
MDRVNERLNFLSHTFYWLHNTKKEFTLPGFMAQGVSYILDDIRRDTFEITLYIQGDNEEPGKAE